MFSLEDRNHVEFDNSECTKEIANNFKKTLQRFINKSIESHFFYSVVYGLISQKTEKKTNFDQFKEILGHNFYLALEEIEPDVMLDHTIFGFFERCSIMNEVLAKFGYFWGFMKGEISFNINWDKNLRPRMKWELNCPHVLFKNLMDMIY